MKWYPIHTILRVEIIAKDNRFVGKNGYGEFIKRKAKKISWKVVLGI